MVGQKVQANIENLGERINKYLPENKEGFVSTLRERKEFNHALDMVDLREQLRMVLEEIMSRETSKQFAGALRSVSSYQYDHSIDVMLLSVLLGMAYNYNYHELLQLGTAALLHDIGKAVIPAIAQKNELDFSLDERILYREHPVFGSILFEKSTEGDFMERAAILQHHERQNGNGYPLRKVGANLPPTQSKQTDPFRIFRFAEIIAVANSYDNYVSPRPGHHPVAPEVALNLVNEESGSILNSHIVQKLNEIINIYPAGSVVKILGCGERDLAGFSGAVKNYNKLNRRLELILLQDASGQELTPQLKVFENDPKLKVEMKIVG
jgi:HD-GYP domain-containing protein (c-di-GMP phosphodiesterase class II)